MHGLALTPAKSSTGKCCFGLLECFVFAQLWTGWRCFQPDIVSDLNNPFLGSYGCMKRLLLLVFDFESDLLLHAQQFFKR